MVQPQSTFREREHLLQELDDARQALRDLMREMDIHLEVYPHWTMKELLAHITGWDDATIASIRSLAADQPPATPAIRGIDYYNEQTVAERDALDYDHIVREFERSRQVLKDLVRELPEEKFYLPLVYPWGNVGTVSGVIEIFTEHEIEHAKEIRSLYLSEPRKQP